MEYKNYIEIDFFYELTKEVQNKFSCEKNFKIVKVTTERYKQSVLFRLFNKIIYFTIHCSERKKEHVLKTRGNFTCVDFRTSLSLNRGSLKKIITHELEKRVSGILYERRAMEFIKVFCEDYHLRFQKATDDEDSQCLFDVIIEYQGVLIPLDITSNIYNKKQTRKEIDAIFSRIPLFHPLIRHDEKKEETKENYLLNKQHLKKILNGFIRNPTNHNLVERLREKAFIS